MKSREVGEQGFGGEGGKGTQALGNVHAASLETRSISLCKKVQSIFNRSLIRPLVLWNFGPDAPMANWHYDIAQQRTMARAPAIMIILRNLILQLLLSQRLGCSPRAGVRRESRPSRSSPLHS